VMVARGSRVEGQVGGGEVGLEGKIVWIARFMVARLQASTARSVKGDGTARSTSRLARACHWTPHSPLFVVCDRSGSPSWCGA